MDKLIKGCGIVMLAAMVALGLGAQPASAHFNAAGPHYNGIYLSGYWPSAPVADTAGFNPDTDHLTLGCFGLVHTGFSGQTEWRFLGYSAVPGERGSYEYCGNPDRLSMQPIAAADIGNIMTAQFSVVPDDQGAYGG